MNKQLQEFARQELKTGLTKCTDGERLLFKRMYAKGEYDIDAVIDSMEAEKLDWAMQQVRRTLDKK